MTHYSFSTCGLTMLVIVCLVDVCSLQNSTSASSEALLCYQGTIQSTVNGQLPLDSDKRLFLQPCGGPSTAATPTSASLLTVNPPTSGLVTVNPPTTAGSTLAPVPTISSQPKTTDPPTTTTPSTSAAGTVNQTPSEDVPTTMCAVLKHPNGNKLTFNLTWTASFTCQTAGNCSQPDQVQTGANQLFCCSTSKCNDLEFFRKRSNTKFATVSKCLMGFENSTVSNFHSRECNGDSHYCMNSTNTGDNSTLFNCGNGQTEVNCSSGTDTCFQSDNTTVCCCRTPNCNGPPIVNPTRTPVKTTPYTVTAQPQSKWMLIAIISASLLIATIIAVIVMVAYRRWKRKQSSNGPLNFSYSRVSADLAEENDDNIFSY